jgi:hypothetical protein
MRLDRSAQSLSHSTGALGDVLLFLVKRISQMIIVQCVVTSENPRPIGEY